MKRKRNLQNIHFRFFSKPYHTLCIDQTELIKISKLAQAKCGQPRGQFQDTNQQTIHVDQMIFSDTNIYSMNQLVSDCGRNVTCLLRHLLTQTSYRYWHTVTRHDVFVLVRILDYLCINDQTWRSILHTLFNHTNLFLTALNSLPSPLFLHDLGSIVENITKKQHVRSFVKECSNIELHHQPIGIYVLLRYLIGSCGLMESVQSICEERYDPIYVWNEIESFIPRFKPGWLLHFIQFSHQDSIVVDRQITNEQEFQDEITLKIPYRDIYSYYIESIGNGGMLDSSGWFGHQQGFINVLKQRSGILFPLIMSVVNKQVVLSGGFAMECMMGSSVKTLSDSDIDIWITGSSKDQRIQHWNQCIEGIFEFIHRNQLEYTENLRPGILTIVIQDCRPLQILMTSYSDPKDVFLNFDSTSVQVLWNGTECISTMGCVQTAQSMRIWNTFYPQSEHDRVLQPYRVHRFLQKGYSYVPLGTTMIDPRTNILYHTYFDHKSPVSYSHQPKTPLVMTSRSLTELRQDSSFSHQIDWTELLSWLRYHLHQQEKDPDENQYDQNQEHAQNPDIRLAEKVFLAKAPISDDHYTAFLLLGQPNNHRIIHKFIVSHADSHLYVSSISYGPDNKWTMFELPVLLTNPCLKIPDNDTESYILTFNLGINTELLESFYTDALYNLRNVDPSQTTDHYDIFDLCRKLSEGYNFNLDVQHNTFANSLKNFRKEVQIQFYSLDELVNWKIGMFGSFQFYMSSYNSILQWTGKVFNRDLSEQMRRNPSLLSFITLLNPLSIDLTTLFTNRLLLHWDLENKALQIYKIPQLDLPQPFTIMMGPLYFPFGCKPFRNKEWAEFTQQNWSQLGQLYEIESHVSNVIQDTVQIIYSGRKLSRKFIKMKTIPKILVYFEQQFASEPFYATLECDLRFNRRRAWECHFHVKKVIQKSLVTENDIEKQ